MVWHRYECYYPVPAPAGPVPVLGWFGEVCGRREFQSRDVGVSSPNANFQVLDRYGAGLSRVLIAGIRQA